MLAPSDRPVERIASRRSPFKLSTMTFFQQAGDQLKSGEISLSNSQYRPQPITPTNN